jgi:hypothetical protein
MKVRIGAIHGALALALLLVAISAQPASAQVFFPPCFVSDGGRITAANGDEASFGGSAATERAQLGHQVYVDHGPLTAFRFMSLTMTTLLCDPDGRRAEMHGTGTVTTATGAEQIVAYRIEMADFTDGRLADLYRITLSNGYDSGPQPVVQGNIQVMGR